MAVVTLSTGTMSLTANLSQLELRETAFIPPTTIQLLQLSYKLFRIIEIMFNIENTYANILVLALVKKTKTKKQQLQQK